MILSSDQLNALDRMGRPFTDLGGAAFSGFVQDSILTPLEGGPIGITSDAKDIDSLCKGGGALSRRPAGDSGLNFGYGAARFLAPGVGIVTIAQGAIALSASLTNYIEIGWDGVSAYAVLKNTSGFTHATTGNIPCFTIAAGASSFVEASVTHYKTPLWMPPYTGLSGLLFSTPAKTKIITVPTGVISATGDVPFLMPSFTARLVRAVIHHIGTTLAADDTNYYTMAITNKQAGAGSVAMLAATAANTTKATGGSALTQYTPRVLTLHGTSGNLDTAADDGGIITFTKTASATNINAVVKLEFTHVG